MCQSVPGPLNLFCSTELRFGIEKAISCATALCKSSRIRRSRILGIVCRFSPWNVFPPMKPAVWGFGLGLLGGQGFIGAKASPWTPYAGFLWHRASLLRLVTPVLSAAVCKSSRIRHSPNSGTRVQKLQNSAFAEFWDCTPVSCFTNAVCQNCKKLGFLRQFAGFRFGAFLAVQEWGWRTTRELDFSHSYEHSFISIYQGWEPGEAASFILHSLF